jgi:hypothetical protein
MKPVIHYLLLPALVACAFQLQAQPEKNRQEMLNRLEAQRVAFITERLDLTPAEAQVFWPVYNEFEAKRRDLNKSFKRPPEVGEDEIETMTDREAADVADNQIVQAEKMTSLRKEYHTRFKAVLPPKKLLKLYSSEHEFQRILMDRLRDSRGPGQGPQSRFRGGHK